MKSSSFKPDELQIRTEELKKSLIAWRNVLVPINNLLEWEHIYDPFVIFGILTFIYICIRQIDPSVLTLVSCLVLIIVLIDLLVPVGIDMVYKNEDWTLVNDEKYSRLCECIAHLEQQIRYKYQSALKIRQERPTMFLMVGSILLVFLAVCGQRIDNLTLTYVATLIFCLIPGVRSRQLIQSIHHHITNFWDNIKKLISSSETNKTKTQ